MSPPNVSSWTQGSVGQCVLRLGRVILNGWHMPSNIQHLPLTTDTDYGVSFYAEQ